MAAALLEVHRELSTQLIETARSGNADRKAASAELLTFLRGQEKAQAERHAELLGAVGKVDDIVRTPPTGPISKVASFLAGSPAVRQAGASAVANLIGILVLAAGAWATFAATGVPPTPTPVQTVPFSVSASTEPVTPGETP